MTTKTATKAASKSSAIQRLFDKAEKSVAKRQSSTVAARKAALMADLADFNVGRLETLKEQMGSFVDLITLGLGDVEVMTTAQAHTLMLQFLAQRDIAEFMAVCRDRIKELAFVHLDAEFADQGEEDPSSINGSIDVPSLGKRFSREGAGYADPTVNEALLKAALGDQWEQVYVRTVVPETVVYSLSMEKLMDLVDGDPAIMEKVRDALTPGAPKTARLFVRDL